MKTYVWDNNQVVTLARWDATAFDKGREHAHLVKRFMVDSSDSADEMRYGFMLFDDESDSADWNHIPKEMFPKEFLTHLLLMGVS